MSYHFGWEVSVLHLTVVLQLEILGRAVAKEVPSLCKYNNEYQYLLHDYFYPVESSTQHSCLLHFITRDALRDMNPLFPKEDFVVYFLPGIFLLSFESSIFI